MWLKIKSPVRIYDRQARVALGTPDGDGYEFVGEPITNDPIMNNEIAIGLRQGDEELKAKINEAIQALKDEGVIEKFAEKYFQEGEISVVN